MYNPVPDYNYWRAIAASALALLLCTSAIAQVELPRDLVSIWPGGVPEVQSTPTQFTVTERAEPGAISDRFATDIDTPGLVVFAADEPTGQALLVIPGGAYQRVVMDKEGFESAAWFQGRGITAFVLMYRLPGESWSNRSEVALQDAQRAMRWIRAHAQDYGVDEHQVGVIGFSAGGHLAATLASQFSHTAYPRTDDVDSYSARPDFAALIYPVVTMQSDFTHPVSREKLLGPEPNDSAVQRYSIENTVHADVPPVLLLHAANDDAVPVENSLQLYDALREHGIPADLHVYAKGGHGFGLRYATDKPIGNWPEIVEQWMTRLK